MVPKLNEIRLEASRWHDFNAHVEQHRFSRWRGNYKHPPPLRTVVYGPGGGGEQGGRQQQQATTNTPHALQDPRGVGGFAKYSGYLCVGALCRVAGFHLDPCVGPCVGTKSGPETQTQK